MEVHTAGKQQDDQENAGDLFVVPIKNIRDGFDLIPRNGFLQSGCHRHNEKRQAADPDNCRKQMKPVVDDRNEDIEIGSDTLEGIHVRGLVKRESLNVNREKLRRLMNG